MITIPYLVIIEQTNDGYSAYFPDVLGCTSAGYTLEGTYQKACSVLNLHLEDTPINELPSSDITKGLKEVEEKDIAMIAFYKRGEVTCVNYL